MIPEGNVSWPIDVYIYPPHKGGAGAGTCRDAAGDESISEDECSMSGKGSAHDGADDDYDRCNPSLTRPPLSASHRLASLLAAHRVTGPQTLWSTQCILTCMSLSAHTHVCGLMWEVGGDRTYVCVCMSEVRTGVRAMPPQPQVQYWSWSIRVLPYDTDG